jgi:hypothetical protein
MNVICTNWRGFERNTLIGFADFELPEIGLLIKECTVHRKGERHWIGLPGRPQLKDGTAVKDQSTGKVQYFNVLQFTGRSFADAFNAAAFAAIRKTHPAVLGDEYVSPRSPPAGRLPGSGDFRDEVPFAPEVR